jgi:hypothetical protein
MYVNSLPGFCRRLCHTNTTRREAYCFIPDGRLHDYYAAIDPSSILLILLDDLSHSVVCGANLGAGGANTGKSFGGACHSAKLFGGVKAMYEAFDAFLRIPTWHTKHALDEERFYDAVAAVVERRDFHGDSLSEYMDGKRAGGEESLANLTDEAYESARDHYVDEAHAIHGYERAKNKQR